MTLNQWGRSAAWIEAPKYKRWPPGCRTQCWGRAMDRLTWSSCDSSGALGVWACVCVLSWTMRARVSLLSLCPMWRWGGAAAAVGRPAWAAPLRQALAGDPAGDELSSGCGAARRRWEAEDSWVWGVGDFFFHLLVPFSVESFFVSLWIFYLKTCVNLFPETAQHLQEPSAGWHHHHHHHTSDQTLCWILPFASENLSLDLTLNSTNGFHFWEVLRAVLLLLLLHGWRWRWRWKAAFSTVRRQTFMFLSCS